MKYEDILTGMMFLCVFGFYTPYSFDALASLHHINLA